MKKKLTNKDIARIAGVSPTAVSFAINGKEGISAETRRHILQIMRDMDYKPAKMGQRNYNVALLFRDDLHQIDQMFYTELNTCMITLCKSFPFNLFMTSTYKREDEIVFSDILQSGFIDGVIVYGDLENETLTELKHLNLPFVVLDSSRRCNENYTVRADYSDAAYKMALKLIEMGHTDIAYIGNSSENLRDFNILTFDGFQRATAKNNISLGTNRIQLDVSNEESLRKGIDRALKGENPPTALFCTTDFYAMMAIRYLNSVGMKVPRDISVAGIDDIALAKYMVPSLTTVKIDREEMGRVGLELIEKLINGEEVESVTLNSYEIIMRESVRFVDANEQPSGA